MIRQPQVGFNLSSVLRVVVLSIRQAITPWIAFVSCDNNSTNSSLDQSIFDLARSKGAVSAVRSTRLYFVDFYIKCPSTIAGLLVVI